jgi:hypothetical protein
MEQLDILRHAVEALERMTVPYVVVGSIASIAYGESRFTQDIDIVAAFEMKHVEKNQPPRPETDEDSARKPRRQADAQGDRLRPGQGDLGTTTLQAHAIRRRTAGGAVYNGATEARRGGG